jgi:serine-type D-Ala-D-Ala carboxypeptidase
MNTNSVPSSPHSALSAELERDLQGIFQIALTEKIFSGASLAVASPAGLLLSQCWGTTCKQGKAIDKETRFDLASLTKPLVTASLYMWAVSNGKLELESKLGDLLPKVLVPSSKRDISVRHLLNHSSGLPPYVPFYTLLMEVEPGKRRETLMASILDTPLSDRPGTVCRYSDLGFLLLGFLIEDLLGAPLDSLSASRP